MNLELRSKSWCGGILHLQKKWSTPLKILLIADVSIAKVIGGAERVLFEQSYRMALRGHDVHILTRRLTHHKSSHAVIRGVNEWRYEADIRDNPVSFLMKTYQNSRKLF